jgi:hypothetical protein
MTGIQPTSPVPSKRARTNGIPGRPVRIPTGWRSFHELGLFATHYQGGEGGRLGGALNSIPINNIDGKLRTT